MKYLNKEDFEKANIFGMGSPNDAFAQYFIGNSYLNPLNEFGESPVFVANVTFEPGCRNNWHIHKASNGGGQILICIAGEGWYQEEGKEAGNGKNRAECRAFRKQNLYHDEPNSPSLYL